MFRPVRAAVVAALFAVVSVSAADGPVVKFTDVKLNNGLRVIISEDHTAPTVSVAVKVAVPPERRFTDALMSPVPLAGHVEPALAAHVQDTLVRSAGKTSVTVAPVTAWGPALEATMV